MNCSERRGKAGLLTRGSPTRGVATAAMLAGLGLAIVPAGASEPVRLTRDGARKIAPTFIEAGAAIVFASHERPNLVAMVQVSSRDGSRRERVLPSVVSHQFDPSFTPDGRYLAYSRTATSPQSVLVIRDRREQREAVFRPGDSRATVRYPSFAPDGLRVVFSLSDVGGQRIASVDRTGQGLTILAASAGISGWPSYSPDGRRIAFCVQPGRRSRALRDGRRRRSGRPADPQSRPRPAPGLVARRQEDRVLQRPRRRRGDLSHRSRRLAPAEPHPSPRPRYRSRPGTPTAGGSRSSPTAPASPRST